MNPSRTVCHRCGATVVHYELSTGKVNLLTIDEIKLMAFWCSTCSGILCTECMGVNVGEGIFLGYGFCPVCEKRCEQANQEQIAAPISQLLKKPPKPKTFLTRLFGNSEPSSGSFAYLFAVTQCKQPDDPQLAKKYLYEVVQMCAPDWKATPAHALSKMAALWETDVVELDRVQLIAWASQAFHEEFKALSTKYDLSFSQFEHSSGNGQVLVARYR